MKPVTCCPREMSTILHELARGSTLTLARCKRGKISSKELTMTCRIVRIPGNVFDTANDTFIVNFQGLRLKSAKKRKQSVSKRDIKRGRWFVESAAYFNQIKS